MQESTPFATTSQDTKIPEESVTNTPPNKVPSSLSTSQVITSPASSSMNSAEFEKAGFILRAAALTLDSFVLIALGVVILLLTFGLKKDLTRVFVKRDFLDTILSLVFQIYMILATGLYGTTLGKKFFHLQVVRVDGTRVGLGKAFVREFLGKFVSSIFFSLGFFWVIWDKNKQAWHDKIAKTYVVTTKELSRGKRFFAYFLAFFLPGLVILGIIAIFILIAINPLRRFEKIPRNKELFERQQVRPDLQKSRQLQFD